MEKLPDPKTIVDSVADGIVELAEGPVRVAKNVAVVADTFATEVMANMDNIKTRMPDDPSVIPDAAAKAVGHTAKAGLGIINSFGKAATDTFAAVENQIRRITG